MFKKVFVLSRCTDNRQDNCSDVMGVFSDAEDAKELADLYSGEPLRWRSSEHFRMHTGIDTEGQKYFIEEWAVS